MKALVYSPMTQGSWDLILSYSLLFKAGKPIWESPWPASRRHNKIFLSFFPHLEHSLQNNTRYSLGPSYKCCRTDCQVQPGILEAPAVSGSVGWLLFTTKVKFTVPQFLTLLSFTPSTQKFGRKIFSSFSYFLDVKVFPLAAQDMLPPLHPNPT